MKNNQLFKINVSQRDI